MKKIVVIRLSSLGDVVLASSVIDPLVKNGYTVDFMTYTPFTELFEGDGRINKVIPVKKEDFKTVSGLKKLAKSLDYDLILDLQSNLKTTLLSLFTKKPVIKYKKAGLERRLYTKPFFRKFLKLDFNVLEGYGNTLKKLGIEPSGIRPSLKPKEQLPDRIRETLPEKFVALGTGARYENKVYPYYEELSNLLLKDGYGVVLIGSEEDKRFDRKPYPDGVVDLRGKLSLKESLTVLSKAVGTISNDTAVAHLSRAVKTPVLMIYGATSPAFGFYPFPDEGDYLYKGLDCQPCHIHGKKACKKGKPECLHFPPEEVITRFKNSLKKSL
ncbi:MAG: glycosyltransferase family 9 protein [Aquificae bacterium]|nr:glycosyltransferase family 9 protein [Aquificota bacterium]